MLLAQFTDFMILLLVAAAIVSGLVGEVEDTIVILGIVVLNAVVGFVQEFRADRAMAALKQLASPSAMVVRDGRQLSVSAEALVPGDIVILEAGNAVPADLRLLEAVDLKLGEAALTGKSLPVEKQTRTRSADAGPAAGGSPQHGIQGHVGSATAAASASSSRPGWRPSWGHSPACSKAAAKRERRCSTD